MNERMITKSTCVHISNLTFIEVFITKHNSFSPRPGVERGYRELALFRIMINNYLYFHKDAETISYKTLAI